MKQAIIVTDAVDGDVKTFQSTAAKDIRELILLVGEENVAQVEDLRVENGSISFVVDSNALAQKMIESLVDMGFRAGLANRKELLLSRVQTYRKKSEGKKSKT